MTPAEFYPFVQLLVDAIADAVAERLQSNRGPAAESSPPDDALLDVYGAAELLNCSKQTVERLTKAGTIPSLKLGTLRRYRRADLLAIQSGSEKGGCDA